MYWKNLFSSSKVELLAIVGGIILSGVLTTVFFGLVTLKYYNVIFQSMVHLQDLLKNALFGQVSDMGCFLNLLFSQGILPTLTIFFLTFCVMHVLHFCCALIFSFMLPRLNHAFKKAAFNHALDLPLDYFRANNAGDIEKNITNVAENFCQLVEFSLSYVSRFVIITTCACLAFKIKILFIGFLSWLLILGTSAFFLFKAAITEASKRSFFQNKQAGFIAESFNNVIVYKLNKCRSFFFSKFSQNQGKEDDCYRKMNVWFAVTRFTYGTINILCFCSMYLLICFVKISSPGLDAAFYCIQFWSVFVVMWDLVHNILPTFFIAGKLAQSHKLLDLTTPKQLKNAHITRFENLEVKNLNFFYRTEQIFNNFSIFCKNEFLLIDGPSGIGKSTLLNIILGLEVLEDSVVFINHHDVKQIKNLYDCISYLPQQDLIFNASVKKNIVLDKAHDANKLKIIYEITKMSNFIPYEEMDHKICGPAGAQISGGQAKRIAIARMLLFDENHHLLLLDEPFNNLSQDIIDGLIDFLLSFKGQRTIICIDHTGHFKKIADKILVMDSRGFREAV